MIMHLLINRILKKDFHTQYTLKYFITSLCMVYENVISLCVTFFIIFIGVIWLFGKFTSAFVLKNCFMFYFITGDGTVGSC